MEGFPDAPVVGLEVALGAAWFFMAHGLVKQAIEADKPRTRTA
jgi:hypothetical protein